jgi:hypothetical protein
LAGTAATGQARDEVAEALGIDPADAARVAAALLDTPHDLVLSAAALWHRVPPDHAPFARWLASLPPRVVAGDLPGQAAADAWAREHTLGLIERFPLRLRPDTLLVLATALATKVSWQVPFDAVPAAALGPASAWTARLRTVLRTPESRYAHRQFVAATRAGDVAVHVAGAAAERDAGGEEGLLVASVIAAPEAPRTEVLAVAHEIASAAATGRHVARRSLFDLPLGEGPLWTVSERPDRTTAEDGREERCFAVLPAWSASSEHDLRRAALGFPAAARGLAELIGLRDDLPHEAKQSAVARYSRVGFEAAAVSAMAVPAGFVVPRDGVVRVAELRFGHPYAVVAVATQQQHPGPGEVVDGPWHGLPVFSAWVATPEDAAQE